MDDKGNSLLRLNRFTCCVGICDNSFYVWFGGMCFIRKRGPCDAQNYHIFKQNKFYLSNSNHCVHQERFSFFPIIIWDWFLSIPLLFILSTLHSMCMKISYIKIIMSSNKINFIYQIQTTVSVQSDFPSFQS